MKKIISALAIFGLSAATVSAQPVLKVGPEVGGTFMTMSQKYDGETRSTQFQPGLRVSGVLDIGFSDAFSLQPGIFLTTNNGTESNYTKHYYTGGQVPASITDRRRYHISYLQIPVYALYKTGDEYSSHFFVGGGPYLGIAVGGRYQQDFTNTLNGQNIVKRYDYPINIGYDESDEIGRYDFGLQATAGFETTFGLYFRVFYSYGLVNTAPLGGSDNNYHQSGGGLTVGFFFKTNNNPRY